MSIDKGENVNFSVKRDSLLQALSIVSHAACGTTSIPALQCILVEAYGSELTLTCNNLEIAITSTITADIRDNGKFLIDSRLFCDIIRKIEGDSVSISKEGSTVNIQDSYSNFDISSIPLQDFPDLPQNVNEFSITLPQVALKELIKATSFAAAADNGKVILTGCFIEISGKNIKFVAMDGYRLAIRKKTLEEAYDDRKLIIPAKALTELSKAFSDEDEEIVINGSSKNIEFSFNGIRFFSRLIEGEYIDYEKIIPSDFESSFNVSRGKMEACISRATLIITNDSVKCPVVFDHSSKSMLCCENQIGKSEEEIPISKTTGTLPTIAFNHRYVIDAIRACPEEELIFKFNISVSPCVITSAEKEDKYTYIILPVRMRS